MPNRQSDEEIEAKIAQVTSERRAGDKELQDRMQNLENSVRALTEMFQAAKSVIVFIKWLAGVATFFLSIWYMLTNGHLPLSPDKH